MVERLTDLFPAILIGLVAALVISPITVRFAHRLKLVDEPGSAPHKVHSTATALTGGVALAISLLVEYLILRPPVTQEILGILLGGLIILVWGVLDDRFTIQPLIKLVGQLLVCFVLIAVGVRVQVTKIFYLDVLITIVWVVGLINAYNFVDSMDGLALGLAGIASAFFMLVTIDSFQPLLAILSAALLGSSMGVFLYNASPARLFIGDSGAQFLGFVLAAIGIAYIPEQAGLPQGVTWFTPILVMGIPIFDMVLVVFSRLRRSKPIYKGGRDHTFHRLLLLGLDPTRAVLLMQLAAVVLGLIAFILLDANIIVANAIFLLIVALGVGLVVYLDTKPSLQD